MALSDRQSSGSDPAFAHHRVTSSLDMRAERGSWLVYLLVLETAWRVAIHRHVAGR